MLFVSSIKRKIIAATILACTVMPSLAQAPATAEKTVTSGSNQLALLLVIVAGALAFVVWGLGTVLIQLSRQSLNKHKESKKSGIAASVLLIGMMMISQFSFAQGTEVVKTVPNYGGLSSEGFWIFAGVIGIEVIAILFLLVLIKRLQAELLPETKNAKSSLSIWWANIDKKIFTQATPVEKEEDVLLDHNYDGIKELDNALPPWWKYGFYITILVAVIYLFNFQVLGYGKNPTQEYAAEMEKARIQKDIYEAQNKDKIDETNVPMADATGIAKGKELFMTNCTPCHGAHAEGATGPNLTDEYWIHKGSLNDVFKTIKIGYPDKGMQSWIIKFNPKEISLLASYVKSLRGSNPANPKAPQGDMYVEEVKAATDSANAKPKDSLAKAALVNDKVK
ncbi:MAG: cbb3-type cytochrome c oxidase N-terminal domain-containing protein [Chitinophagaceae bacterium]